MEDETTTWPFGALYATDPIGKKGGNSTPPRATDLDFQGGIKLFLHNKEKDCGCQGFPERLVILPWPVVKVNGQLQKPKMAEQLCILDPSEWVTPPGKEPQPAEVPVKRKGKL